MSPGFQLFVSCMLFVTDRSIADIDYNIDYNNTETFPDTILIKNTR